MKFSNTKRISVDCCVDNSVSDVFFLVKPAFPCSPASCRFIAGTGLVVPKLSNILFSQGWQDSNLQSLVLETTALPIRPHPYIYLSLSTDLVCFIIVSHSPASRKFLMWKINLIVSINYCSVKTVITNKKPLVPKWEPRVQILKQYSSSHLLLPYYPNRVHTPASRLSELRAK